MIVFAGVQVGAQEEIVTVEDFFDRLSERYGEVEDYIAEIEISRDDTVQRGTIYYRRPNQIRIDYSEPAEQVMVSDGSLLQVYIPLYNVVLEQRLRPQSSETVADLASEQGLSLLRRNYSASFVTGPDPVPLEEGSDELVVKMQLQWRTTSEGYRQLELAVNEDLLIRRITGITVSYEEVQFDFTSIRINQNIPEARFEYEADPSANVISDFLYGGEG